ncbi:MAG: exodeoxyribonuclease VII small subunit [Lachnospiraceae bacterium]|jgi:exodeoxyribonuclease VII small subunit|uniref:exodeoxyribonuclease VII small subunit n=1 Tax=uncultured Acetatifactor sp. TaxID=1671927 RepID=UPI002626BD4B|nr:exodeoxyribonuclease VII small subunit [uncultured Acetatifactor sp.]MCI8787795.1 exodeoxyribonuclease VII small subunit [Lachnospiraceae bacterium]
MAEETRRPGLEENFARLDELIGQLDRDDIPLEEAFQAYSAGMALVKQCNDQIDKVEKQVLKLTEEGQLEEFGNGSISI